MLTYAGVYVSQDQGLTWTQTNLLHAAIQSLLCSHDQPDSFLYLLTGIGPCRMLLAIYKVTLMLI